MQGGAARAAAELRFRCNRHTDVASEAVLRVHAQGMRTHCPDQRHLDGGGARRTRFEVVLV